MEWFTEAVKQVPSLVVLAFIVYQFMRHLQIKDSTHKDLASRFNDIQKNTNEVIKENTRMLGQVCTMLRRINGEGGPK